MAVLGWGKDPYGAVAGWFGTGASVSAVAAGIATITGLGNMSTLSVGRSLTLYGAANAGNNGTFTITEYVSASSVKVSNANAVVESPGSIGWIERLQTQPSVYGAGVKGVGTSIVAARALATHEVAVTLSAEPMHSSNLVPGDALNPATWTVQRLDTAEFLHVVNAVPISPVEYGVITLEGFAGVDVLHTVSSATLLDPIGELLHTPKSADFYGVLDENEVTSAARLARGRVTSRDVSNYHTPTPANSLFGGTLAINAAGDYESMSGAPLVKKLLIRRLISKPRDFFHLPDYGVGLRDKEPIPAGNLGKLRAEIDRQARLEPEVSDVAVGLTLSNQGVLTVQLRAKLVPTGQEVQFTLPVGQGGVTL